MNNRLRELTGEHNKQPSGLPLSEAGTRNAAAAVSGMADMIHQNAALTINEMRNFADILVTAEVEVGSRRLSLEQLRSDPELRRNARIWKEILSGNYGRREELTLLTPVVAPALAQFGGYWLCIDGLTFLDSDSAAALAEFGGRMLSLDGLTALEPDTAAALARFGGKWLNLNSLTSLDKYTVTALAGFPGTILCQPAIKAQIDRYKTPSS